MRVLFLCNNVPGVNFWRMYQFQKKMVSKGVDAVIYKYEPHKKGIPEWELVLEKNKQVQDEIFSLMRMADVVVMGYAHIPITIALIAMFQMERNLKIPILCEIDDDIISTPDYNPAYRQGWIPGCFEERVVIEHLKMADTVIASTNYLANLSRRFNRNIHTIPNCIDFNLWNKVSENQKNKLVKVGWIGGGNHDEDFRILERVIPIVLSKSKDIEFSFVHGVPDYIKKLAKSEKRVTIVKDWVNIDQYPDWVAKQGFDIGIAPLLDNKFNRAKSNLKFLEYSAIGIPGIYSDIEPYSKTITHGRNGYLFDRVDDWVRIILDLAKSKKLREKIGTEAYNLTKKEFNLDTVTDRYISIVTQLTTKQKYDIDPKTNEYVPIIKGLTNGKK